MMLEDFKTEANGTLIFSVGQKKYKLKFERYYISPQIERIKVFGKEKEILLQSDRPYLKLNDKKKAIQWKIISPISPELYKHPLFISTLTIELEWALDHVDFDKTPKTIVQEIKNHRN